MMLKAMDSNCKYVFIAIGVNDHLEVWSKDRWEDFMNTNEDNFSDIADSLFSSDINI